MLDDGNDLARRKPVRRTVAERSAIVAETYRPGATVAGVARRHGIVASQLSSWRSIAKSKADQDKQRGSGFAEITVEANDLPVRFDGIEVVCGAVVIRLSFHLAPVVDHMFKELKRSDKLFADETRCPVLDPGRGKTKTGYLWAIARDVRPFGGSAPPGVVFCYADGRGGKHATEFLTGFSGTLQVDGYTGYNTLTKPGRTSGPVKLAYCWAHARRKLKEVHDRDGSPIAKEGLKRIAKFYKIEEAIRGQSVEQRKAARQEQTKPLVDDFEVWLKVQRSRISAKSRLGEKLSYIAKYMDGLKLFLDDGTVEMDSNIVERAIRPIALNRKNALFAGHDEGGRTWARIASLIETCKLNDVEPYAYLKATLEAIAAGHPSARIDELMPWNYPFNPQTERLAADTINPAKNAGIIR
jgi:transposase